MIDDMGNTRGDEITIEETILICRTSVPGPIALTAFAHLESLYESEESPARHQIPMWLLGTSSVSVVDFFCSFHAQRS